MRSVLSRFLATSIVAAATGAGLVAIAAPAHADSVPASEMLNSLDVATEKNSPAYGRDLFKLWVDADGDGCDARAEVLIAESATDVTYSSGCTVAGGSWTSYYDNVVWTVAGDVDIDHLVPLQEVWQSGATTWTAERREAYANDLGFEGTLVAVTDNLNSSKGSKDYAEWVPPEADAQCRYAYEWIQVKTRWDLAVDSAEKGALATQVEACGDDGIGVPPGGGGSTAAASAGLTGSGLIGRHSVADGEWLNSV